MIQIKEEKIAELMFDIWHKSNDLKNPVMVGEYIAEELTKVKNLAISGVSKRYYHEVCGKGTLIKEYEHSVYGTMLMVKPLNKKDIYFAPKVEFTELPFS